MLGWLVGCFGCFLFFFCENMSMSFFFQVKFSTVYIYVYIFRMKHEETSSCDFRSLAWKLLTQNPPKVS